MSIQIKLKNSVVQDSTPSTSDLPAVGEIALNANINSIGGFMRASNNTIVKIFGPGSLSTPTATTTVSGISELATNSETTTGTATNRVVTPAGLNAVTVAERTTSNNNYVAKAGSTLTGVLTMPNGSNSAPAINFGDSDSGIFGGTNTVSLAAGGTTRLTADTGVSVVGTLAVTGSITSTSNLTIGDKIIHAGDTNTAIRFPAADTVSIETSSSERARVDSTGRFLLGTSTARTNFFNLASTHTPRLQIESTNNDNGRAALGLIYGKTNASGPYIVMAKHRSNTVGDNTVVQSGDETGIIAFQGSDGTQFVDAARIQGFVDGTPGADDMPGRLVFSTTADGASSPTDRLTINSSGLVTVAGALTTTNGAITANVGTNNQVIIGGDGAIEISRNGGGAFIDFKNDISEDQDARIQENNGGFTLSGNVDIGNGCDVTGNITGTGNLTIDTNTLHVDSTNNRVGIGLTNPAVKLHISGTSGLYTRFQNTSAGNNVNFGQSAGDGVIDVGGSFALRILTNGSDRVKVDSSGRLLLGTTTEGVANASKFTIADTGHCGMTIRSGTSHDGQIAFSDGTSGNDEFRGQIRYNHGSNYLTFVTDATERMRIASDGKIGIGNSNPINFVDIHRGADEDNILIVRGQDVSGEYCALGVNGSNAVVTAGGVSGNNTNLVFRTAPNGNETEKMRLDSSGRLMIGTTTEGVVNGDDLNVASSGHTGITIRSGTSNQGNIFFSDGTSGADEYRGYFQYLHAVNALLLGTDSAERMRIDSAGRVGIGTSNIGSHQLVVEGGKAETGGSSVALKTSGGANGNNSNLALYGTFVTPTTDQGTRRTADIVSGFSTGNWGNEFLAFHVGKGGSSNDTQAVTDEQMRIDTNGRLMVGVTSANDTATALTIKNGFSSNEHTILEIICDDNETSRVTFSETSNMNNGSIRYSFTNDVRAMTFHTNGQSERMRITNNGNVHIARTSAMDLGANNVTGIDLLNSGRVVAARNGAAALHIGRQGDTGEVALFANQGTAIVGSISVTTSATAFNTSASDRTLKKNFENWTENTLNLFKNINPQKFNFTDEEDTDPKHKGYVAQDLIDSFPEAYNKNDNDKYMFNPSGMVVYLMKAIQELEAKVAALEAA